MWIVYLAKNQIADGSYVGITSGSMERRRYGHHNAAFSKNEQRPFARALRKYGRDAFVWSEIGRVESEEAALEMERFFIAQLRPRYNATEGGDIRHLSREQRVAAHHRRTRASYLQRRGVSVEIGSREPPTAAPPPVHVEGIEPEWRSVPGYEGAYEVSDHGQVRSCDRQVPCWSNGGTMFRRGKIMGLRPMSDGRMFITLQLRGKRRDVAVSVLVAMAFIGAPESGQRVIRRNRDLLNDRASNLYWGDAKEMAAKRKRTGGERRGEAHPNSKITDEQVRFIRKMRGVMTQTEVARVLGVERGTITMIQLGRSRVEAGI